MVGHRAGFASEEVFWDGACIDQAIIVTILPIVKAIKAMKRNFF
jgi:hypothetical protein